MLSKTMTMQDLSEGVFISVANFTLARRDSYLEYLHTSLNRPRLLHSVLHPFIYTKLLLYQLIMKAEEGVARSEERRSSSQSHQKPGRFHPYASSDKSLLQQSWRSSMLAWKQIRECQQSSKSRGKASTFSQKPAKGSESRK